MNLLRATFSREICSALCCPVHVMAIPAFYLLVTILFPLALGPDHVVLKLAAPGLIIVAALFAAFLPLEKLFTDDAREGTLDLVLLSGQPFALYVTGKIFAQIAISGLPLLLVSPIISTILNMPPTMILPVIASLIPVIILLNLLGALGAALALGSRAGNIILALVIMPLYCPVLIFGASAIDLAANGISSWTTPLLFLWAVTALAAPLAPIAAAAILKGLNE